MKNQKPSLVYIIMGPTGVGKSDFAIQLAEKVGGEIINGDMGQLYEPLTIGTAKPEWRNASVAHHLFDVMKKPENYSVKNYRKQVLELIRDIINRNKTPIIVGGSGFYINSLFFPPVETETDIISSQIPESLPQDLWQMLKEIDPQRAQEINPQDSYRLERAIHIWQTTGVLPSQRKPLLNPIASHIHLIHVTREREEIYQRINTRTEHMLRNGWIEEVWKLPLLWKDFLKKKKLIGYPELIEYLSQAPEINQFQLMASIQQSTRRYAKRQLTFWRMLSKKLSESSENIWIDEINLTLSPIDLYIRQLQEKLLLFMQGKSL